MGKQTIELGRKHSLDLGASCPVEVIPIEFIKDGVICEYVNSWSGRIETLGYELFEMNGYFGVV